MRTRLEWTARVAVTCSLFAAAALADTIDKERPMSERPSKAWILLDYDMDYLRKMIRLAPDFGIDQIQLSHYICMYAEEILNEPERARDLTELIALGKDQGLEVLVWTHELAGVPARFLETGKVDLDSPALYDWLDDKYERVFRALPQLDGLVVTYSETDVAIFDDQRVVSAASHAERITRITNALHAVCKRHGKKLIARDWANVGTGSWDELMEFEKGLRDSNPDVIVMTKHTAGDWYLLADNPLMGQVGDHPQICEFDIAGEHHGKQVAPWCHPEYIQDRWRWALAHGADGAAARTERYDRHILGTPGEINLHAFSRIVDDPDVDVDTVWMGWAAREFGERAAPKVVAALKRTDAIALKTFYARRAYWGSDHSRVPRFGYLHSHLAGRTAVPFDPAFEPIERDLLNPTPATLEWVLAEKDEAIALAEASLADIDAARNDLRERDYLWLRDSLEKSAALAYLFREINECYFHVRFIEGSEGAAQENWVKAFEASSLRLIGAGDVIFRNWGYGFVLGHSPEDRNNVHKTLARLLDEMQQRVKVATGAD